MLAAEKSETSSWSWQDSYAEVDAKGDLKWKPQPFVFETSGSIRYIDFEKGDDANSGAAPETPWKHHPWDPSAVGKSATGAGVHTYVFKRGEWHLAWATRQASHCAQQLRPEHPFQY